jgi:hypothetical protein
MLIPFPGVVESIVTAEVKLAALNVVKAIVTFFAASSMVIVPSNALVVSIFMVI